MESTTEATTTGAIERDSNALTDLYLAITECERLEIENDTIASVIAQSTKNARKIAEFIIEITK